MLKFALWLRDTPVSEFIQNVLWIIPFTQTIHIICVSIVLSSIAMLALRIFGLAGMSDTIASNARRFLPWIWTSLVILLMTGTILIVGEPVRELINPAFQFKMVMLVVAIALTAAFQITVGRGLPAWTLGATPPPAVKAMVVLTLLVWLVIPVAGRWIAYMVVDYAG